VGVSVTEPAADGKGAASRLGERPELQDRRAKTTSVRSRLRR